MSKSVIRAPASTAGQSDVFNVRNEPLKVSVYPVADLTESEHVDLQEQDAEGTFGDLSDSSFQGSGGQGRLSSAVTSIVINATGTYRLDFDSSTNAIGAYIEKDDTAKGR